MNTTEPQPIAHVHANAPVIEIDVAYFENIKQVAIDFTSYDHVRVSTIHLDPVAALGLAVQLLDAYKAWTTTPAARAESADAVAEFDCNRAAAS